MRKLIESNETERDRDRNRNRNINRERKITNNKKVLRTLPNPLPCALFRIVCRFI